MNQNGPEKNKQPLFVTKEFKKQAAKAILAILGFIALYFLLIALSLGLVALCGFLGFTIITVRPGFYTLVIGAGIVVFAVMIFIFLVKFMFAKSQASEQEGIEITAEDQPELFSIVYELAELTGTSKPKKIFLSADVNACVFYNSSFWSMFLPIRKNLKIGLGLVNAVNISELKAVIAHEFGHFSQKSMKVGSWVYQVNKIIHNMLFNNQGYKDTLESVANTHAILSFFVHLTVNVVQAIQFILRQMYTVVNKTYLGLSREMEFHADLVAASICGSNNIINALKRSEFADLSYNTTMEVCNRAWNDKKIVSNFYNGHFTALQQTAVINNIPLNNGLPIISEGEVSRVSPRIIVKDQWASHPGIEDRKNFLEPFNLERPSEETSAWSAFINADKWKEELTKVLYSNVQQVEVKGTLVDTEFSAMIHERFSQSRFPEVFGDFYDYREVEKFDIEAAVKIPFVKQPFENVLTEEFKLFPKRLRFTEQDIAVLKAIINKEISTRSFDFDGVKYNRRKAPEILAILESELDAIQKQIARLDPTVFHYFYSIAPLPEAEALRTNWLEYFQLQSQAEEYLKIVNQMLEPLGPIFSGEVLDINAITQMITNHKRSHEPLFKAEMQKWLNESVLNLTTETTEKASKFLAANYQYFANGSFFEAELMELNSLAKDIWTAIFELKQTKFRSIAIYQAMLLEKQVSLSGKVTDKGLTV
jgi:Zn-dependent protease with chaperone function